METNIFEGAKFGDKFLTRDGYIALYLFYDAECISPTHVLIVDDKHDNDIYEWSYRDDGTALEDCTRDIDIVSRYQETIDEDKLDEIARGFSRKILCEWDGPEFNAFKAGYRSAFNNNAIEE